MISWLAKVYQNLNIWKIICKWQYFPTHQTQIREIKMLYKVKLSYTAFSRILLSILYVYCFFSLNQINFDNHSIKAFIRIWHSWVFGTLLYNLLWSTEADNRVQNDIISKNKFNGSKQKRAIKTIYSPYTLYTKKKEKKRRQEITNKKKE